MVRGVTRTLDTSAALIVLAPQPFCETSSETVFQGDLNVSSPLRVLQQAQRRADAASRGIQNRGVAQIDEFSSNLHMLMFGNREVLRHVEIESAQARSAYRAYAAIAEGPAGRLRVRGGTEPLVTALGRVLLAKHYSGRDAVRPRGASVGAGNVRGVDGQREAGVKAQDATHLPAADDGVECFVKALSVLAVTANG